MPPCHHVMDVAPIVPTLPWYLTVPTVPVLGNWGSVPPLLPCHLLRLAMHTEYVAYLAQYVVLRTEYCVRHSDFSLHLRHCHSRVFTKEYGARELTPDWHTRTANLVAHCPPSFRIPLSESSLFSLLANPRQPLHYLQPQSFSTRYVTWGTEP